MPWYYFVAYFFGGALLANAVPHFVSGVMGRPFQSPFAKPPGEGLSSSTVNVIWGWFNLAVGYVLLFQIGPFDFHKPIPITVAGLGVLVMGVLMARSFGRFHGGNSPGR